MMPATPDPHCPPLARRLLEDREQRVVICLGPGGVGKTTTAASLALSLADAGERVLVLTVDPSPRLMHSLGFETPPFEACEVAEAPGLFAQVLSRRATLDALIAEVAPTEAAAARILNNRLYAYVAGQLAGMQEFMAVEALYRLLDDPRFDRIVLDTPPIVHAYDLLEAPARLLAAFDARLTRWLLRVSSGQNRGAKLAYWALSRFTGERFLDELIELLEALQGVFSGLRAHAEHMQGQLVSSSVAYLLVTRPAAVPVSTTLAALSYLRARAVAPFGVVVNATLPGAAEEPAEEPALATLVDALPPSQREQLLAIDTLMREDIETQRQVLQRLLPLRGDTALW